MKRNITISVIAFLILALLASGALAAGKARFDWIITKKLTVQNDADINAALDMNANAISNIGDTGTDFDSGGGLTLATGLVVTTGGADLGYGVENIGLPSVITVTVPYTPATGTVATVADGEIWFVHNVFIQTNANFDCTGDDCTMTIGDGNDADGFLAAADASIQAAFTEATGYAAGFYGIENGSGAAYTLDDGGPFVYAPSGAAETIDYAIGGTDPAAGSATAYVIYTRIQ